MAHKKFSLHILLWLFSLCLSSFLRGALFHGTKASKDRKTPALRAIQMKMFVKTPGNPSKAGFLFNPTLTIPKKFQNSGKVLELNFNYACIEYEKEEAGLFDDFLGSKKKINSKVTLCGDRIESGKNGIKSHKKKIILAEFTQIMNIWANYAHINFVYAPDKPSDFLIHFCLKNCAWHSTDHAAEKPLMVLDLEQDKYFDLNKGPKEYDYRHAKRVILHETGHLIGLNHEHFNTDKKSLFSYDLEAIKNHYLKEFPGANEKEIEIWLKQYDPKTVIDENTQRSSFDCDSVMKYTVKEAFIMSKDKNLIKELQKTNFELSLLEKVAISVFYPGRKTSDRLGDLSFVSDLESAKKLKFNRYLFKAKKQKASVDSRNVNDYYFEYVDFNSQPKYAPPNGFVEPEFYYIK